MYGNLKVAPIINDLKLISGKINSESLHHHYLCPDNKINNMKAAAFFRS